MTGLREQLQAVYDRNGGRLTPQILVAEARDENHPLHDHIFDRPVAEAAEVYYLHRAHELIRSVRVVYTEDDRGPRSVRAFHAVRAEAGGFTYEPAEKVANDPFQVRLLMADMEREWKQLRRRYEEFAEFWRLVSDEAQAAAGEEEAA